MIRVARLQTTELTSTDGKGILAVKRATDATTADGVQPAAPLTAAPGTADTLQGTLVFPARPGEPLAVTLGLTTESADPTSPPADPTETLLSLTHKFD